MRSALRLVRALLVSSLLWASHGALPVARVAAESAVVVEVGVRAVAAREHVQCVSRCSDVAEREYDSNEISTSLPPTAANRAPKQRLHLAYSVFLI